VRHALKAGYDGPLSLEIFNDEFRASSARRTAADGRRSLLLLEEQLRRQAEAEPEGGRSWRRRIDLLDPPPPPELSGVAFIEFTVEGEENVNDTWLNFYKYTGMRLKHVKTGESDDVALSGVFIAIGHKPNTDVFADWLDVDAKGYLVAHDHTRSKIDGVFIAGDVHDHRYRQAVTAAGDGCKAAIDAERWLEAQGITEANTLTAW